MRRSPAPPSLSRRALLAGGVALSASPTFATPARPMRIVLLGQSLIQRDLCRLDWPGRAALVHRLARADVVFTDLETAIDGPGAGPPARAGEVLHAAGAEVIDCLKSLGVTIVTTANNHAGDMGPGGILAGIAALDARGIVHAGSGATLERAAGPAIQTTRAGRFALVAAAAGAIREGAAATATRPGVAELRRNPDGTLDAADVARTLAAIRTARAAGATVLMCLHNHYWEPDQATTPAWQRSFARACVDAGAAAFVAHGTPLMQARETYRGAPLYHGLGNFIFQTRKPDGAYGPATWRSLLVEAEIRDNRVLRSTETPLRLDPRKMPDGEFSWGTPSLAG